jgi:hypothetical protein
LDMTGKEFDAAVEYVKKWWDSSLADKAAAKEIDLTPKEYAMASIGNGLQDGHHEEFLAEEDEPKQQEIAEVDQDEVKKALRLLTTRENSYLGFLYEKWEEYNDLYFFGQLNQPLITIDKMNNKTLGSHTRGQNDMGITNHIRLNRNFIALNEDERILETLRHEMIHQWQEDVLYMKEGVAKREIKLPAGFGSLTNKDEPTIIKRTKSGSPLMEKGEQKPRPKDWHNKDFKEYAVVVGIPAKGDKCYGNIANMPEGKSYNRKFSCKCIASNGAPLTIWSTREIKAVCQICKKPFQEQKKEGKTVKVTLSHIEQPGEDAVFEAMKTKGFTHFEKFKSKRDKDRFLDELYKGNDDGLEVEQGAYQKGHNAYQEGFTHWVAYNGEKVELPKEERKNKPAVKSPKAKKKPTPKKTELTKAPDKPEDKKKTPAKKAAPKKPAAKKPAPKKEKPVEQPKPVEKKEEPKKLKMSNGGELTLVETPKEDPKTPTVGGRSHTNPKDLLSLYMQMGSIKKVADYFGMTSAAIIYQAKKHGVDFKKGVIEGEVKSK